MFEEAGIDVPDAVVDRAHQIGLGYADSKTKQKCKRIIICYTIFRHRARSIFQRKFEKKS